MLYLIGGGALIVWVLIGLVLGYFGFVNHAMNADLNDKGKPYECPTTAFAFGFWFISFLIGFAIFIFIFSFKV